MFFYIVDRFEIEAAYCEDETGRIVRISRLWLPPEAKEGDVLTLRDGSWVVDPELTAQRREASRQALRKLFRRGPE